MYKKNKPEINNANALEEAYSSLNRKQKTYFRRRMQEECGWYSERTFKSRLAGKAELTPQDIRTIELIKSELT